MDVLNKICSHCNEEKSFDEYHKDCTSTDGFCRKCKKCTREYRQNYYHENRNKEISLARIYTDNRRKNIRNFFKDYLVGCECIDCGETNRNLLEFDHVRGDKLFTISEAKRGAYTDEKIMDEVKKCEIRCCNCHRLITYYRRVIEREKCLLVN